MIVHFWTCLNWMLFGDNLTVLPKISFVFCAFSQKGWQGRAEWQLWPIGWLISWGRSEGADRGCPSYYRSSRQCSRSASYTCGHHRIHSLMNVHGHLWSMVQSWDTWIAKKVHIEAYLPSNSCTSSSSPPNNMIHSLMVLFTAEAMANAAVLLLDLLLLLGYPSIALPLMCHML